MSTILNAAPQANLQGINDQSRQAAAAPAETYPQFLPHIYLLAQKGQLTPQLMSGDNFAIAYGTQTLDVTKPYYNHASALVQAVFGAGGSAMIQRLVPADAKTATLAVSLDLLATTINSKPGFSAKFVVGPVADAGGNLGTATMGVGTQTDGAAQSDLYPLFELKVSSPGSDGNNQGFAITAPTTISVPGADVNASAALEAFIFNFRQISRTSANATGSTTKTISGDQTVPFTLKPNAYYAATNRDYGMADAVINAYQSVDKPGYTPVYGNFGEMYIYQANIDLILDLLIGAENTASSTSLTRYQFNLFTGKNQDGVAYATYQILGASQGGVLFGSDSIVYAQGGADGDVSLTNFDALVLDKLTTYQTDENNLQNMALWPHSWFIDSGFSTATKNELANVMATRKDLGVLVSTQDVSLPQNDASADSSTAIALAAMLATVPESAVFGTPVCRAAVIGQSGYSLNTAYKGLLPQTIDVAAKMAAYMGAANGNWKSGLAFDKTPLNRMTSLRAVNATSKSAGAYSQDWANNLVWTQNYDRASLFYPAFQTVYPDDTSVLNSLITVAACMELEKVCFRVWRDLVGRSDLTQAQFIKESNRLIEAQTPKAKFDGRFVIKANTYFTAEDTARGWSWSTDITIYANPMVTVGTFTINSDRMSSLATTS